jgi:succinate dehydrogenase / fumarate reductase membrane anchor subunit
MLGCQVVIEDYVHEEWAKVAGLLAMKAVHVVLGLASVLAVLRIAL